MLECPRPNSAIGSTSVRRSVIRQTDVAANQSNRDGLSVRLTPNHVWRHAAAADAACP